MSEFIDMFKSASPTQRRLFLAQMDLNASDADTQELHRVLTQLHATLNQIQGANAHNSAGGLAGRLSHKSLQLRQTRGSRLARLPL
jgi:hypothetical protein